MSQQTVLRNQSLGMHKALQAHLIRNEAPVWMLSGFLVLNLVDRWKRADFPEVGAEHF